MMRFGIILNNKYMYMYVRMRSVCFSLVSGILGWEEQVRSALAAGAPKKLGGS